MKVSYIKHDFFNIFLQKTCISSFHRQILTPSQSFKDVVLKKMDNIQSLKAVRQDIKRRKVNPFGDIVTNDEQFQKNHDEY